MNWARYGTLLSDAESHPQSGCFKGTVGGAKIQDFCELVQWKKNFQFEFFQDVANRRLS